MLDLPEVIKREIVTLSEVKKILETIPVDEMDQIQRWTFDYSKKFSKVDYEPAKEMVDRLVAEGDLTNEESVELVNVMPRSIEELRAFTFGWKKLIVTEKLEKIKSILLSNNENNGDEQLQSQVES
ncbi:RNA polymerase Rpb4 [Candidatus Nitrosocosmicus oleophilus]|uniref:DNA-directed RNA polymerase subunit Rpo4 n=1 Tax=Candidatus Nitrosocosmicus oleophilus TaxID=1353260 RepID=A0A654LWA0_9ARCH|nr:RNA polymerase Rpb4 [Candidatus Nitrosocosmicus oleophilus]